MAVNIGLSTSFAADVSFVALIPVLLGEINFSTQEIAFMMTVFFASDLGARILYSIINTFYRPRSRYVYFFGTVLSAIMRIGKFTHKVFITFTELLNSRMIYHNKTWKITENISYLNL